MEQLLKLLAGYNISNYEITDRHYGYCYKSLKPLKILYIDRFMHNHDQFNKLGYGIITRG